MLFSIIIPVYNTGATLGMTLESLLEQTYKNFEIILVNDGSTDELTIFICDNLDRFYTNVKIQLVNKKNGGLCSARNEGVRHSNGDVLIFLDSDDLLPNDTLENYYNAFKLYRPDIIQGKMLSFDLKKIWESKSYEKVIKDTFIVDYESDVFKQLSSLCISPCIRAYNKDYFISNNLHFLEGCMMSEDHYFTSLMYSKKPKLLALNKHTYLYRRDGIEQSTNMWKESYLDDILYVQKRLDAILLDKLKASYYERFLTFEFKKFIHDPMLLMDESEIEKHIPKILALLNVIPREYKKSYLPVKLATIEDADELRLYFIDAKRLNLKKILKDKCPKFKKIRNILNKIKLKIIDFLDLSYKKILGVNRLNFVIFMYKLLSIFTPIKQNKLTFAIRPADKFKYLKEFKEEALARKTFAVKTLLAKKVGFFEDLRIIYHLVRSKIIIIDGHYWYLRGLKTRKNQIVIQAWHAGGLGKKFGLDMFKKDTPEYYEQLKHHVSYSYAMVSADIAVSAYMSAFNLRENQILKFGNIISDRIINNKKTPEESRFELGLKYDKKLVLYAPTFREPYGKFTDIGEYSIKLDFSRLKEIFGNEYTFAVRVHSNYKKISLSEDVINLSSYDENLVLSATDILITDYSSIMFTFLNFRRPILLYAYDLPIYVGQRNTYLRYDKYAPGKIVYNEDELIQAIKDIDNIFNEEYYEKNCEFYMQYCDGKTAKRMIDFCEDIIKGVEKL